MCVYNFKKKNIKNQFNREKRLLIIQIIIL